MKIIAEPANLVNSVSDRRRFLHCLTALGASGFVADWVRAEEDRLATPAQTAGPYYPIPTIAKQKHHDTDLTRKLGEDEVAKGETIVVKGRVLGQDGRPLAGAVVEIWQASADGRYNHPRDNNPTPLDEKFQYWGRMSADKEGAYQFTSIKPGEYPGRTPHIHFRVLAPQHRQLVTQIYFADEAKRNARDGIYRSLSRSGRNALTVELTKESKPKTDSNSSQNAEKQKPAKRKPTESTADSGATKSGATKSDIAKKSGSIRSGIFEIVLKRA